MKTSLIIPDAVYRATKQRALETQRTISDVVESALRDWLETGRQPRNYTFDWKPVRGRHRPDVNVDDRDALYDAMENRP